jgi:hypothetical protein
MLGTISFVETYAVCYSQSGPIPVHIQSDEDDKKKDSDSDSDKNKKEDKNKPPTPISENPVPLAIPHKVSTWSLSSLILGMVSLLVSILLFLANGNKQDDAFDFFSYELSQKDKHLKIIRVLSIITGLLPLLIFFTMEDIIDERMVIADWNTTVIAILFLIHIGLFGYYLRKKAKFLL